MLRKVAIAVAILFVGAVVALVVVVAVFDFNRLKPLITARVANSILLGVLRVRSL
jgi:hypothetical protein